MLAARGFEVLRFGNTAILTDIETVIATIFAAVSGRRDGGVIGL